MKNFNKMVDILALIIIIPVVLLTLFLVFYMFFDIFTGYDIIENDVQPYLRKVLKL